MTLADLVHLHPTLRPLFAAFFYEDQSITVINGLGSAKDHNNEAHCKLSKFVPPKLETAN